ncbi:Protein of unknown function [Bacillus toyonensis]|nr:Protein of unknown function [Bacillus toyonensis]
MVVDCFNEFLESELQGEYVVK